MTRNIGRFTENSLVRRSLLDSTCFVNKPMIGKATYLYLPRVGLLYAARKHIVANNQKSPR